MIGEFVPRYEADGSLSPMQCWGQNGVYKDKNIVYKMKLVSVLVFLSAYSVTSSLVVEVPPACPKTAAEALMVSRLEDLITCSPSKLVRFYRQLDCCFVNIAECNKISKAFQIEGGDDICSYRRLRSPEKKLSKKMKKLLKKKKRRLLRKKKFKHRRSNP